MRFYGNDFILVCDFIIDHNVTILYKAYLSGPEFFDIERAKLGLEREILSLMSENLFSTSEEKTEKLDLER